MTFNAVRDLAVIDTEEITILTFLPPQTSAGTIITVDNYVVGVFKKYGNLYKPVFYEKLPGGDTEYNVGIPALPVDNYQFTVKAIAGDDESKVASTESYVGPKVGEKFSENIYAAVILDDLPQIYLKANNQDGGFLANTAPTDPSQIGSGGMPVYTGKNPVINDYSKSFSKVPGFFGSSNNTSLRGRDDNFFRISGTHKDVPSLASDNYLFPRKNVGASIEMYIKPTTKNGSGQVLSGPYVNYQTTDYRGEYKGFTRPLFTLSIDPETPNGLLISFGGTSSLNLGYLNPDEPTHLVFSIYAQDEGKYNARLYKNGIRVFSGSGSDEYTRTSNPLFTLDPRSEAIQRYNSMDFVRDGFPERADDPLLTAFDFYGGAGYDVQQISYWTYPLTADQALVHYLATKGVGDDGGSDKVIYVDPPVDVTVPNNEEGSDVVLGDWHFTIPPGPHGPNIVITVDDPENNNIAKIPFPPGFSENDSLTWRKDGDWLYLILNGKIYWAYHLSALQMSTFPVSGGYYGFYGNGKPIATPAGGRVRFYRLTDPYYKVNLEYTKQLGEDAPFKYSTVTDQYGVMLYDGQVEVGEELDTSINYDAYLRGGVADQNYYVVPQPIAQAIYNAGYTDAITAILDDLPTPVDYNSLLNIDFNNTVDSINVFLQTGIFKMPTQTQINSLVKNTNGSLIKATIQGQSIIITGSREKADINLQKNILVDLLPDPNAALYIDNDVAATKAKLIQLSVFTINPTDAQLTQSIVSTHGNKIIITRQNTVLIITGSNSAISYVKTDSITLPTKEEIDAGTLADILATRDKVNILIQTNLNPFQSQLDTCIVNNNKTYVTVTRVGDDITITGRNTLSSTVITRTINYVSDPQSIKDGIQNDINATRQALQNKYGAEVDYYPSINELNNYIVKTGTNNITLSADGTKITISGTNPRLTDYVKTGTYYVPFYDNSVNDDVNTAYDNILSYTQTNPNYTEEDLQQFKVQSGNNIMTIVVSDNYITISSTSGITHNTFSRDITRDNSDNQQNAEWLDHSADGTSNNFFDYIQNVNPTGPYTFNDLYNLIYREGETLVDLYFNDGDSGTSVPVQFFFYIDGYNDTRTLNFTVDNSTPSGNDDYTLDQDMLDSINSINDRWTSRPYYVWSVSRMNDYIVVNNPNNTITGEVVNETTLKIYGSRSTSGYTSEATIIHPTLPQLIDDDLNQTVAAIQAYTPTVYAASQDELNSLITVSLSNIVTIQTTDVNDDHFTVTAYNGDQGMDYYANQIQFDSPYMQSPTTPTTPASKEDASSPDNAMTVNVGSYKDVYYGGPNHPLAIAWNRVVIQDPGTYEIKQDSVPGSPPYDKYLFVYYVVGNTVLTKTGNPWNVPTYFLNNDDDSNGNGGGKLNATVTSSGINSGSTTVTTSLPVTLYIASCRYSDIGKMGNTSSGIPDTTGVNTSASQSSDDGARVTITKTA